MQEETVLLLIGFRQVIEPEIHIVEAQILHQNMLPQ